MLTLQHHAVAVAFGARAVFDGCDFRRHARAGGVISGGGSWSFVNCAGGPRERTPKGLAGALPRSPARC